MKVDWKAIIALTAALVSAYAQYRAETAHTISVDNESSISWTEHRMTADKKGRKQLFKDINQRLQKLEKRKYGECNENY